MDASTIARAARGARRPAALSRPETDAAADDDGRSCLANLPMAEILETGTRPEAASTRRAPLEHAGTARIEARDAISDVSLGFEPPQTRRGPDAPWRRSERREGEGARDVTSSRRKNRRSTDRRAGSTTEPCDAGWRRAPRSTRGETPFRERRCAANDGDVEASTRVSSEAPIATLITSLADFFRGTAGSFGHKKRVDACFWSGNAENAGSRAACGDFLFPTGQTENPYERENA